MKYKKWDVIRIYWLDSISQGGWMVEKEVNSDDLLHESVGMFWGKTKHVITIVQSKSHYTSDAKQMVGEVFHIPLKAIVRIQKL